MPTLSAFILAAKTQIFIDRREFVLVDIRIKDSTITWTT